MVDGRKSRQDLINRFRGVNGSPAAFNHHLSDPNHHGDRLREQVQGHQGQSSEVLDSSQIVSFGPRSGRRTQSQFSMMNPRLTQTAHRTAPTRSPTHPPVTSSIHGRIATWKRDPGKTTEGGRARTSITRPSDRRMPPTKTSHTQCVSRTYTLGQDVRVIIEANPSARERGERTRPSGRRMPRVTTTMTTTTKGRPRPLPARRRGRRQCLNI